MYDDVRPGLEDVVADTISADEVGTYKPAAELYEHAAGRIGHAASDLLYVTASWSDANGGLHAGLQVGWLDRKGRAWEPYAREPDLLVTDLHDRESQR